MEAGSLDICLREERASGADFLAESTRIPPSPPHPYSPHSGVLREEPRVRS